MAEQIIEDGLYYIVEAMDPTKCMHVSGWSSDNGGNVKEAALTKNEGQTCFVSAQDGGYSIGFPLTGKVLCVADKGAGTGRWYLGSAFGDSTDTDEWVQSNSGVAFAYVGDMYLNQLTLNCYRCTFAGVPTVAKWTFTKNVSSDVGDPVAGTVWYGGTAISGVFAGTKAFKAFEGESAVEGGMYLNLSTAQVYRCALAGAKAKARWEYVGSIQNARTRTDDRTNVYQHDWDGTDAELWEIEDAHSTVVCEGQTLGTFFISTKLDAQKVLKMYSAGTETPNLVIYTRDGSPSQQFAFLPIECVPDGTYRIVPQAGGANTCVAVKGNSSANDAKLAHAALADDNNFQVWKVDALQDGTCSIRLAADGRALDCSAKAAPSEYDYAVASEWAASDDQCWVTRAMGAAKFNDVGMPAYHVASQAGEKNLVLDAFGTLDSLNTYVTVNRGTPNAKRQRYMFVPAEAYAKDLAVPTGLCASVDGERGDLIGHDGVAYCYPCWKGMGDEWQVRYRTRARAVGAAKVGEWSAWKALGDGSSANSGWGEAGQPNCTVSDADGWHTAQQPVIAALGASSGQNDLVQIEFQARRLAHAWGDLEMDAHGGAASKVCTVAFRPSLAVSSVSVTPNGAEVAYSSTMARGSNRVRAYVQGLFDASATGANASGTLKAKALKRVPEDGEEVTLFWELTTPDGITASGSEVIALSCTMDGAAALTATERWVAGARILQVTSQAGTSMSRMWMTPEGGDAIEIEPTVGRRFDVPYPLNRPFSLLCAGIISGAARVWKKSYRAVLADTRIWNWEGTEWCEAPSMLGATPNETATTEPTYTDRPTTSRSWHRVGVGSSLGQSRTLTAAVIDAVDDGCRDRIRALAACRYAWYRNPEGEVVRVAIVGVTETKRPWGEEVVVDMRRVD